MNFHYARCSISDLPIEENDEVYMFSSIPERREYLDYSEHKYQLQDFISLGQYDGYGGLKNPNDEYAYRNVIENDGIKYVFFHANLLLDILEEQKIMISSDYQDITDNKPYETFSDFLTRKCIVISYDNKEYKALFAKAVSLLLLSYNKEIHFINRMRQSFEVNDFLLLNNAINHFLMLKQQDKSDQLRFRSDALFQELCEAREADERLR